MRTDKQINAEIAKIQEAVLLKDRWNYETRKSLDAQIYALSTRMTITGAENHYYIDETSEEYSDGDNEIYHEVCQAIRWMNGDEGEDAPSSGL